MNTEKENFLEHEAIPLLRAIPPGTPPRWGKMNLQQMTEHMSYSLRIANGKSPRQLLTPADKLESLYRFMMSDKPFRENTPNAELGDEPVPVTQPGMPEALDELQAELTDFFRVFRNSPELRVMNPFFGNLNYQEWVQLLHKHFTHHLRQFGVEVR